MEALAGAVTDDKGAAVAEKLMRAVFGEFKVGWGPGC